MTLRQLRDIASELGVGLYSRKSKDELLEAIAARQANTKRSLKAIEAEMAPINKQGKAFIGIYTANCGARESDSSVSTV